MTQAEKISHSFSFEGTEVTLAGFAGEYIFERIRTANTFYELPLLETFADLLVGKPGVVIDAGANIGNHTAYFGAVLGREVRAFEAHGPNFELLEENVARNGLGDRVQAHRVFLAADEGTTHVQQTIAGNGGTFTQSADGVEVTTQSLDALIGDAEVAGIKIDVEGAEVGVLTGARQLIERWRPVISVESHNHATRLALSEALEALGYQALDIKGPSDNICWVHHADPRLAALRDRVQVVERRGQERRYYSLAGTLRQLSNTVSALKESVDQASAPQSAPASAQQVDTGFGFELGRTVENLRHSNERVLNGFGELTRQVGQDRSILLETSEEQHASLLAQLQQVGEGLNQVKDAVEEQQARTEREKTVPTAAFDSAVSAFAVLARELERVHPAGWLSQDLEDGLRRRLGEQGAGEAAQSALDKPRKKQPTSVAPSEVAEMAGAERQPDDHIGRVLLAEPIGESFSHVRLDVLERMLVGQQLWVSRQGEPGFATAVDQGNHAVVVPVAKLDANRVEEYAEDLAERYPSVPTLALLVSPDADEDTLWTLSAVVAEVGERLAARVAIVVPHSSEGIPAALTAAHRNIVRGPQLPVQREAEPTEHARRDGIYLGRAEDLEAAADVAGVPAEQWLRKLREYLPGVALVASTRMSTEDEGLQFPSLDVDELWQEEKDRSYGNRLRSVHAALLVGDLRNILGVAGQTGLRSTPVLTPLGVTEGLDSVAVPGLIPVGEEELPHVLRNLLIDEETWRSYQRSREQVWLAHEQSALAELKSLILNPHVNAEEN